MTKEKVIEVVFNAIDKVNKGFSKKNQIEKSMDTVLFGGSGVLDSLGLVTLIAAIEERVEDMLGVSITLADERAIAQKNSPFKTVGSLVDHIASLLKESAHV